MWLQRQVSQPYLCYQVITNDMICHSWSIMRDPSAQRHLETTASEGMDPMNIILWQLYIWENAPNRLDILASQLS